MSTMLAAFAKGLDQWKVHGHPTPQHLPLNMEEFSLAASLNMSERTELGNVSDWDNPVTHPVSQIYSAHPPLRQALNIVGSPKVPTKTTRYKARLLTDTRLVVEDSDDKLPTRACLESVTTPEISKQFTQNF